jgi:hypothetical protein
MDCVGEKTCTECAQVGRVVGAGRGFPSVFVVRWRVGPGSLGLPMSNISLCNFASAIHTHFQDHPVSCQFRNTAESSTPFRCNTHTHTDSVRQTRVSFFPPFVVALLTHPCGCTAPIASAPAVSSLAASAPHGRARTRWRRHRSPRSTAAPRRTIGQHLGRRRLLSTWVFR